MENGHTDTDMGLNDVFKEMEALKSMCVKVGITEDVAGKTAPGSDVTLVQIAAWNELGVLGPPMSQHGGGKWFIPPRPFLRGFADGQRELIAETMEKLGKLVSSGKLKASAAMERLGILGESGVKTYIDTGSNFTPNADATIARKRGSTRPLINVGTLRNSIRYQVINKPVDKVGE